MDKFDKEKLPWDCEVELEDIANSNFQTVALLPKDHSDVWLTAPVSSNYNLIPNQQAVEIVKGILDEGEFAYKDTENILWSGRRFRRRIALEDSREDITPGDTVCMTVDINNSYDGSKAFGIAFNAIRLICANGLTIEDRVGELAIRHIGNGDWQNRIVEYIQQIGKAIALFKELVPNFRYIASQRYSTRDFIKELRMMVNAKSIKLPASMLANILNNIELNGHNPTRWDLYCAITKVLTEARTFSAEAVNKRITRQELLRYESDNIAPGAFAEPVDLTRDMLT